MQLGNTFKTRTDVDKSKRKFEVNTIAKFIECVSVMAVLVRERRAFDVEIKERRK